MRCKFAKEPEREKTVCALFGLVCIIFFKEKKIDCERKLFHQMCDVFDKSLCLFYRVCDKKTRCVRKKKFTKNDVDVCAS